MKRIPILMLSIAVLLINCGSDDTEQEPTKETPAFIGTWEYSLPEYLASVLKKKFDIGLTINDDKASSYSLTAIYTDEGDTALIHNGYWVVSNSFDTVFLHGTDCAMYDTLNNIINDDCGLPVPVPINISHNVWDVSLGSLAPIAPSLGINLETLGISLDGITIQLKKAE
jgi:hypothetical protein